MAKQRAQSHLNDEDNSDIYRAQRALARAENRLRVANLNKKVWKYRVTVFPNLLLVLICLIMNSIIIKQIQVQCTTE